MDLQADSLADIGELVSCFKIDKLLEEDKGKYFIYNCVSYHTNTTIMAPCKQYVVESYF